MSNKNAACAEQLALEAELQQAREEITRLVALQGESQREAAAAKAALKEAREEIARLAVMHAAAKAELKRVVLQNVQLVANQGQSQPALKAGQAYEPAKLQSPTPEWKTHGAFLASSQCPPDLQQAKGRGDKMKADDHGHGLPRSKSASAQGASLISPVQPALSTFECGFVGLVVTSSPPHRVKRVHGLLDRHCVRHDQHGYGNCTISEDDRVLQVDGVNVESMDITTLQRMLCGPLHSTVVITLASHATGDVYRIEALRHRDPSLDHSLSQGLPSNSRSMAQWTVWEETAAKAEAAAQVAAHATVTMDAEGASPSGASEHMMLSHRTTNGGKKLVLSGSWRGPSKVVQTARRSDSLNAALPALPVAHALSDSLVASIFGPRPASAAALCASPGVVTLQMPCGASCRVPSLRCSKPDGTYMPLCDLLTTDCRMPVCLQSDCCLPSTQRPSRQRCIEREASTRCRLLVAHKNPPRCSPRDQRVQRVRPYRKSKRVANPLLSPSHQISPLCLRVSAALRRSWLRRS